MNVTVEFPAEDRFETAYGAKVHSPDGKALFLVGDNFFVEIEDMEELAHEMIRVGSNANAPIPDSALD